MGSLKNKLLKSINCFYTLIICISLLNCNNQQGKMVEINAAQKPINKVQIYLNEFDVYILPDSCNSKMHVKLPDNKGELRINLADCMGKMNVNQYDSSGNLILNCNYAPSLDTLKTYSYGKSAVTGQSKVTVLDFFQPLPDGEWNFYKNNKIIRTIKYKSGVEEQ